MKKKVNMFGKTIPLFVIVLLGVGLVSALLAPYLSGMVTAEVTVELPMVVGISAGRESWATAQCYRSPSDGTGNPGSEVPDWAYCSLDAGDKWHAPLYITEAACTTASGTWFETGGRAADAPYIGGMVDCFPEGVDGNNVSVTDWDASDWKETITLPVMYTGQDKTFTLYLMSENVADVKIYGHEEIRVANPLGITCLDFVSSCRFDSIYGDHGYGKQWTGCNSEPDCHNIDDNLIELWAADESSEWDAEETEVAQWGITFDNVIGEYTFSYRITPLA